MHVCVCPYPKVRELLESEAEALRSSKEWQLWFQLPFIRDPASDPAFQVYKEAGGEDGREGGREGGI